MAVSGKDYAIVVLLIMVGYAYIPPSSPDARGLTSDTADPHLPPGLRVLKTSGVRALSGKPPGQVVAEPVLQEADGGGRIVRAENSRLGHLRERQRPGGSSLLPAAAGTQQRLSGGFPPNPPPAAASPASPGGGPPNPPPAAASPASPATPRAGAEISGSQHNLPGSDPLPPEQKIRLVTGSLASIAIDRTGVPAECLTLISTGGCAWTRKFSCPALSRGSDGVAKDDGTDGFVCCCGAAEGWRQHAGPREVRPTTWVKSVAEIAAGTGHPPALPATTEDERALVRLMRDVRWLDDAKLTSASSQSKDARVAVARWGPDGRFRVMAARACKDARHRCSLGTHISNFRCGPPKSRLLSRTFWLDIAGRYQVTRALSPGTRGPATQARSMPRSLSLRQPRQPTPAGASPNALHLLLNSRSTLISGGVLPGWPPNLCSNGHVVFTCSTQNRMTFPGIPPTAPFDGVGGKVLHTRRSKVLDSKRLLGGPHLKLPRWPRHRLFININIS